MKKRLLCLIMALLPISVLAQDTGVVNISTISFNVLNNGSDAATYMYITSQEDMINPAGCKSTSYYLPDFGHLAEELNLIGSQKPSPRVKMNISDTICEHNHPYITQITVQW